MPDPISIPNPGPIFGMVRTENGIECVDISKKDFQSEIDIRNRFEGSHSLFSVKRENADGNPKSISASIKSHTQEIDGQDVTNWSEVVDDVFSQNKNGDCLPKDIQAQRQELKDKIDHGGTQADEAREELANLDQAIVECAKRGEKEFNVDTSTWIEHQFSSIDESLSKATEKAPGMMADAREYLDQQMSTLGKTLDELDTKSDEYKGLREQIAKLEDMSSQMASSPDEETLREILSQMATVSSAAEGCPHKH